MKRFTLLCMLMLPATAMAQQPTMDAAGKLTLANGVIIDTATGVVTLPANITSSAAPQAIDAASQSFWEYVRTLGQTTVCSIFQQQLNDARDQVSTLNGQLRDAQHPVVAPQQ